MDPLDPFFDLVKIQSSDPDKSGTGWLVRPGLVLTALHCVTHDESWRRADKVYAYLGRELTKKKIRAIDANIVWPKPLPEGGQPPDIALLELLGDDKTTSPRRELQFGDWPLNDTAAWTVGYPQAQEENNPRSLTPHVNLPGTCWTLAEEPPTIGFNSNVSVPPSKADAWKGLSGGPLVVGNFILGVMRRYPNGWDPARVLEAEPITTLLSQNQKLCDLLGARLPLPRARNIAPMPVPPEFRKLSQIIHFFDRTEIATTVKNTIRDARREGTSVEIIAYGREVDRCDDLVMRIDEEALKKASGLVSVTWPKDASDPVSAAKTICENTAYRMRLREPWPNKWDDIAADLKNHSVAPWFHIALPNKPTPLDLHLLDEWRRCWAGVRRAPGEAAGYVLTFEGVAADRDLLKQLKMPASGLASEFIELGPHSMEHVRKWPVDIRDLLSDQVLRSERDAELQFLARSLEPYIDSRGWISFSQKDLLWLLEGTI
jgi:hypothetical protein